MADIWSGVKTTRDEAALATLAAEARRDLERLCVPAANWVPPRVGPDGRPMLDVLVVGGGLCGQTVAFALMRDGIRNIRVIDRAERGAEGPWGTYARMQILRSPKHLTGPDLGVPSLTFRAWFEAQHGADGWQRLHKPGRLDWRDYLLFVRDCAGLAVENGVEVRALESGPNGVRAVLRSDGRDEIAFARHVVLATGRDGAGGPRQPSFPGLASEARGRVFHSSDAIDVAAFAGRHIAVLGAGASAFDCAAEALEAGARVTLAVRRPHLPQVNKPKWMSFPGFMKGFYALDDATRWDFFTYAFAEQVPPPWESVQRCDAHAGFDIRFGVSWRDVVPDETGVTVVTPEGTERYDAVILGTGFDVDILARPELAPLAGEVLLWRDRVSAGEAEAHPECARFPYLGPGFELIARAAGNGQSLARLHLFNWGVTLSHAALAGDIPGLRTGVERLSQALCTRLLADDIATHRAALQALDDPELKPTRWYVER